MNDEKHIMKAEFNPNVCTYWLMSGVMLLIVTVVGIPFLIFWLPLGLYFTNLYLQSMECLLTEKALKVKKGIMFKREKTVPLEKITDMGMIEGPLMRHFGIQMLTIETAGTSGPGSLVSLTGIVDAKGFREAVLAQRDAVSASDSSTSSEGANFEGRDTAATLVEIKNSLLRIEETLKKRIEN